MLFRSSRSAGGQPGEAGGLMWRIESAQPQNAGYYAAAVGRLSLDIELVASGTVCLRGAASDSGILVGWFNSLTAIGAPPANFLGILIEGPSRIGHYFRPAYGTSDDIKAVAEKGPIIQPDGKPHRWTVRYAPAANEGRGRITVTFDDESVSMDLKEGARKGNAALDRFGFVSFNRGGNYVDIYFDDLVFTAQGRRACYRTLYVQGQASGAERQYFGRRGRPRSDPRRRRPRDRRVRSGGRPPHQRQLPRQDRGVADGDRCEPPGRPARPAPVRHARNQALFVSVSVVHRCCRTWTGPSRPEGSKGESGLYDLKVVQPTRFSGGKA